MNGCEDIDKIMAQGNITCIPTTNLTDFENFDDNLRSDEELRKKLVRIKFWRNYLFHLCFVKQNLNFLFSRSA